MKEFIKLFENIRDKHGFALEIYNSSIVDWCINIGYKCTVKDKENVHVIQVQDCDITCAFARAYIEFTDWLTEHDGGY